LTQGEEVSQNIKIKRRKQTTLVTPPAEEAHDKPYPLL